MLFRSEDALAAVCEIVGAVNVPEKDGDAVGAYELQYAVVASLVELSPTDCVVAVVPLGSAGVPDRFAAVVAVRALPVVD